MDTLVPKSFTLYAVSLQDAEQKAKAMIASRETLVSVKPMHKWIADEQVRNAGGRPDVA